MKKIFSLFAGMLFCAAMFAADVKLYFVNVDGWDAVHAYVYTDADPWPYSVAWPGDAMTKEAEQVQGKDLYSYSFDEQFNVIIFNNNNGQQTPNQKWDAAKPYYFDGAWYATKEEIPAPGEAKYYLTGTAVGGWDEKQLKVTEDSYTIEGLKAGEEYKLKVLPTGSWSNNKGYDELTSLVEGSYADKDRNVCFTMAEDGDVVVTYTDQVYTVTGNFKVLEVKFVPGVWVADDAKFAAWVWDKASENYVRDHWTAFFEGEGDTLSFKLGQAVDSIIFVRFAPAVEAPSWDLTEEQGRWNSVAGSEVDKEGLTYTITGMGSGQWEVYTPVEPIEDGYYLNGTIVDWKIADLTPYKFVANPSAEGEYLLANVTLKEGDEIKACYVENNAIADDKWYGVGEGSNDNLVVSAEQAGVRTVYFNPTWQDAWKGFIYIDMNTTAISNTAVEAKAIKTVVNGMLVIEKAGVRYNVIGQVIR